MIQRLKEADAKFFANDNIAKYLEDGEIDELVAEVEKKMEEVLRSLVIDTENDHNTKETAKRVAKMFIKETFGGRYTPPPDVTAFPNTGYEGLYVTGPISVRSVCAHHLQNIKGSCWVGVVPSNEVIGLSKFNRVVHHIAHRPQIQEEMTTQIADALQEEAKTENIAVVIKAEHMCMTARGIREHESDMATTELRGGFKDDPALRQEFYSLLHSAKGFS